MGLIAYIVVAGLIGLIAVPFIMVQTKNAKRVKALKQALTESASGHGLTLSQSEVWRGTYAVGVDTGRKQVVYVKKEGSSPVVVVADLAGAVECKLDTIARTEKTPNGSLTIVEALNLIIGYSDKSRREKRLEFYNSDINPSLGNEKILAEKWRETIASLLS